jgi:hypothetical protein
MTSPQHLSQSEAERRRAQLRKGQAERDQARLTRLRRRKRWNQWGERIRASALFLGIVVFFTWIYWLGVNR